MKVANTRVKVAILTTVVNLLAWALTRYLKKLGEQEADREDPADEPEFA